MSKTTRAASGAQPKRSCSYCTRAAVHGAAVTDGGRVVNVAVCDDHAPFGARFHRRTMGLGESARLELLSVQPDLFGAVR